jgi:simple sugar transport system ATP-binding protein
MAAEGKSIVFISHKLNEVMQVADRVTVLRQGKVTAAALKTSETSIPELAKLMVGRSVIFNLDKKPQEPGGVVLELQGVSALNDKGLPALSNVSFKVHAGEVVGLAGVAGNGQRELAEVITGLRKCTAGRILVNGEDVTNHSALASIRQGVSHVPEDRNHVGSSPNLSITDNVIMKSYRQAPLANGWSLNYGLARKNAQKLKDAYQILAPNVETQARLLSGGNLQRAILARELSAQPKLLIAMQPTRGLDVGAIEGVQRLLLAQREAGAAIVLSSEELEELFALADRILVMYEGEIVGDMVEHDLVQIGLMMTGGTKEK